jgi:uncharacterized FlaG/YvyC family protein
MAIAVVPSAPTVANVTTQTQTFKNDPITHVTPSTNTTTLSFAFDSETKSLRVVITDQASGEILRKFEYNAIPSDLYRSPNLLGLLLDQQA